MEQGIIPLISRPLYKHHWNLNTPFELLTKPGGQAPGINQGCLAELLAKLTTGLDVQQYVDVLKTLGIFITGERLSAEKSKTQVSGIVDSISVRSEAFLESLETSCTVVACLTHVREHALRLKETSICVYLVRIIKNMLYGVNANTATKSTMTRVMQCCFYAIRRCIDTLLIPACKDADCMNCRRNSSDGTKKACELNRSASIARWKIEMTKEGIYALIVQAVDILMVDVLPEIKETQPLPSLIKIVHKLSCLDTESIYLFIDEGWTITACTILSRQSVETSDKVLVLQTFVIGMTRPIHSFSCAKQSSTLDYLKIINESGFFECVVNMMKHLLEIGETKIQSTSALCRETEEGKTYNELTQLEMCLRCTRLALKFMSPDCDKHLLVMPAILQRAVHLFLFGPIRDETIIQHCFSIAKTMYANACSMQLARVLISKMHDMMQYISSIEVAPEQESFEATEEEAHLLDQLQQSSDLIFVLLISDRKREVACDVPIKRLLSLVAEFVSSEISLRFWIRRKILPPLTEIALVGCDLLPKTLRSRMWKVYKTICNALPISTYAWSCTTLLLCEHETTGMIRIEAILSQIKLSFEKGEKCMDMKNAYALIFYLQLMAQNETFMDENFNDEFKCELLGMIRAMLHDRPSSDCKIVSISIIVTILASWVFNKKVEPTEEQSCNLSKIMSLEEAEVLLNWTLWCIKYYFFPTYPPLNLTDMPSKRKSLVAYGLHRVVLKQTSIILTRLLHINRTFVREILHHQVTKELVSIATLSYYSYDRKVNISDEVVKWVKAILDTLRDAHGALFAEKLFNLSSEPIALALALLEEKGIHRESYESSSEFWKSVLGNQEDLWSSGNNLMKSLERDHKDDKKTMIVLYVVLYRCENDASIFDEQSEKKWVRLLDIIADSRFITCKGPGSHFTIQQFRIRRLSLQIILLAAKKLISSATTNIWTPDKAGALDKVLQKSWHDVFDGRCKEVIWIAWLDLAAFQLRICHRNPSIASINSVIETKLPALETISQHICQHKNTNTIKRLTSRLLRIIRRITDLIVSKKNDAKCATITTMLRLLSSTAGLLDCRIVFLQRLLSHTNGMSYVLDLMCIDSQKLQNYCADCDGADINISEEVVIFLVSNIEKVRPRLNRIGKAEIQGILNMMNISLGASSPYRGEDRSNSRNDDVKHLESVPNRGFMVACLTLLRTFIAKKSCATEFYNMNGLEILYKLIASSTQSSQQKGVQLALEISSYLTGHSEFAANAALPSLIKLLYTLIDHCSGEGSITALSRLAFLIIDQYVTHAAPVLTSRFAQECHTQLNDWKENHTTHTINEKAHQVILKLYYISFQESKSQNADPFENYSGAHNESQIATFFENQSMLEEAIARGYRIIRCYDNSFAWKKEEKAFKLKNTEDYRSDIFVDLDTGTKFRTTFKRNQFVPSALFSGMVGSSNHKKTIAIPAACAIFEDAVVRLNAFLLHGEVVTQVKKHQSFVTIIPALTSHIAFHSDTTELVILCLQIITRVTFVSPKWFVGHMCATKSTRCVSFVEFSAFLTASSLHVTQSTAFALLMSDFCENIALEYAKLISNTERSVTDGVMTVVSWQVQKKKCDDLLKIAFFLIKECFEGLEIVRGGITVIWTLMKMHIGRSLFDYAFLLDENDAASEESYIFGALFDFWVSVMRKHIHDEWVIWKCLKCLQFVLQFDVASNQVATLSSSSEYLGRTLLETITFLTGLLQTYRKQTFILQLVTVQLSSALRFTKLCVLDTITVIMEIMCRKEFLSCLIQSVENNAENKIIVLESLRIIRALSMYTFESMSQASPPLQQNAVDMSDTLLSSLDETFFCRTLLQSFRYSSNSTICVTSLEILSFCLKFVKNHEVESNQSNSDEILNLKLDLKGGILSSPHVFQAIMDIIEHELLDVTLRIKEVQMCPLSTTLEMSIDLLYDLTGTKEGQDWMDRLHGLDFLCSIMDTVRIWIDMQPSSDNHEDTSLSFLEVVVDCIVNLGCHSQYSILSNWKKAVPWLLSTAIWFQNQDEVATDTRPANEEESIYLSSLEKFIAILSALFGQNEYTSSRLEPKLGLFYDFRNEQNGDPDSRIHFHLLQLLVNLDVTSIDSTPSGSDDSNLRRHIEIRLFSVILKLCYGDTEQLIYFLVYDGIPIVLERIYLHLHDPERLRLSMSFLSCLFCDDTNLLLPTTESQIRTTLIIIMQQYERKDKSIHRTARDLMTHLNKIDQNAVANFSSSQPHDAKDDCVASISPKPQTSNGSLCDAKQEQLRQAVQILSNSSTFRLRHVIREDPSKQEKQDESLQISFGEEETIMVTLGYSREYFIFRSIAVTEDATFWDIFAALMNYRSEAKKGSYIQPDRIWLSQIEILPPLNCESCRRTARSKVFPCAGPRIEMVPLERYVHLLVRQESIVLEALSSESCSEWKNALQTLLERDQIDHTANVTNLVDH